MPTVLLQNVEPRIAGDKQRKWNLFSHGRSECLTWRSDHAQQPIVLLIILQSVPEFLHPMRIHDGTRETTRHALGYRGTHAQVRPDSCKTRFGSLKLTLHISEALSRHDARDFVGTLDDGKASRDLTPAQDAVPLSA